MVERNPTGGVVLFLRGVTNFRRKFRRGSPTPTPKPRRGGEPSMGFCRAVYGYTCRRQDGKLLRSCVRESSIESSAGDRCCDVAATCFCRRNGSQNEPQVGTNCLTLAPREKQRRSLLQFRQETASGPDTCSHLAPSRPTPAAAAATVRFHRVLHDRHHRHQAVEPFV